MNISLPRPLTRFGRTSRAIILVALLLGSLFPAIGDIGVANVATGFAAVVIIYEIFRWIPLLHPVLVTPIIFGLLVIPVLVLPPLTEYGDDKITTWSTATLITAMAACMLRDKGSIQTFSYAWIAAASILALISIIGFTGGRVETFDANPIWLARAMATAAVMILYLVTQRLVRPWIFLVVGIVLVGGIFATGSRGPLVAVAAGAIVLVVFSRRHRIRRILGILIAAVASFWALTVLPFFSNSRILSVIDNGDADTSRQNFWALTLPLIARHPGGVGLGNWSQFAGAPKQFNYPHNLFLEYFAEGGVLFGIGLLALVLIVLIRLFKAARNEPLFVLILALVATELAQVSVSGDLNARTFWFLLTLGFLTTTRTFVSRYTGLAGSLPIPEPEAVGTPRTRRDNESPYATEP